MSKYEELIAAAVAARKITHSAIPHSLSQWNPAANRPLTQAITGPTVWTRDSIREEDYVIELDAQAAAGIVKVRDELVARGKSLTTVVPEDFHLPEFARAAGEIRRRIDEGVGFALLRGLPFSEWRDEDATMLYWGIGTCLGTPLPQNRSGDRVYLVTDSGKSATDYGVRGSRTNTDLVFHTDSASAFADSVPDILGLLCLRRAIEGGRSRVVSAHAVYNQLLARSPRLLEELHRPFFFDRSAETKDDEDPVTAAEVFTTSGGSVRARYNRFWIELGHRIAGTDLTAERRQALVALDAALEDTANVFEFDLRPGDVYFNTNHTVLHNRTAFVDSPDPSRRRCLVRLWLAARSSQG